MGLAEIIESGLKKVNSQRTQETLGDRTEYIGASDMGQCSRKAVLDRFTDEVDLATLINFERGHMAEDALHRALQAEGYGNVERGVEVQDETPAGTPLRIHLDFCYRGPNRVAIMEAKSTHPVPPMPHEGWVLQLKAQLGAVQKNFPEKEVSGTIFALDVAPKKGATHKVWNTYTPDDVIYQGLMEKADLIYNGIQEYRNSGNLPDDIDAEPSLLCGHCPHIWSCPKFQEQDRLDGLQDELTKLTTAQSEKKRMEEMEKSFKEDFKEVLRPISGWVGINGHIVRLKQKQRKQINYDELNAFLENHGSSLDNFREKKDYEEVEIKKVKKNS